MPFAAHSCGLHTGLTKISIKRTAFAENVGGAYNNHGCTRTQTSLLRSEKSSLSRMPRQRKLEREVRSGVSPIRTSSIVSNGQREARQMHTWNTFY